MNVEIDDRMRNYLLSLLRIDRTKKSRGRQRAIVTSAPREAVEKFDRKLALNSESLRLLGGDDA